MTITIDFAEEERQMALLSFAVLSLHRPGFDDMLGNMADIMRGRDLYERFKELNRDQYKPDGNRTV